VLQKIVLLWLQGYTDKEVSARLGVAQKTISRRRERIKVIWSAHERAGS
jgi:DNA-binding CsgD family transcriptional regulator